MSVQSLVAEVIEFGNIVGKVSPNADSYNQTVANYRKLARELKLARERSCVNTVLDCVLSTVAREELTLGYMLNGVMYCTHKAAVKHKIPNCYSTEVLHEMKLSQDEWDSLEKYHVWVKTGLILERCH